MPTLKDFVKPRPWILIYMLENDDEEIYPLKVSREIGTPLRSTYREFVRLKKEGLVIERRNGWLRLFRLTEEGRRCAQKLLEVDGALTLYLQRFVGEIKRAEERVLGGAEGFRS
jgi:Mn-dependent DtxR family transcriptional regulator